MKRRQLPIVRNDQESMEKAARLSTEIFIYGKTRWSIEVRSYRLLLMLSQALTTDKNGKLDFFPEYVFSLSKVYTYLGLKNTNRRHELLVKELKNLLSACIETKVTSKEGKSVWVATSFITWYMLDEENHCLKIQLNENIREYLVGMKRWCSLRPKYYLKLSTLYQNWLYTFFRKELDLRTYIKVKISTLKEMMILDNIASYDPSKNHNANLNLLKYLIGIEKAKGSDSWEYTKNSKGEDIGTLAQISKYTDMIVTAYPVKKGGVYTHIVFKIVPKSPNNTRIVWDKNEPEKAQKHDTAQSISAILRKGNMFPTEDQKQEFAPKSQEKTIISAEIMEGMAHARKTTPEALGKALGYIRREDGTWEHIS